MQLNYTEGGAFVQIDGVDGTQHTPGWIEDISNRVKFSTSFPDVKYLCT